MKGTFLLAVLCVAFVAQAKTLPVAENQSAFDAGTQDVLEDLLISIINSFRQVVRNGLPCMGIPPLDPLVVPPFGLNLSSPLFTARGSLANVSANGLGDYETTRVRANLITLGVDLGFALNALNVSGAYDLEGLAWIFPIYGKGPFNIHVGGIDVGGQGRLVVQPFTGRLSLANLGFSLTLRDFNVKFEGLLGGGELGDVLNEIANDMGLKVFEIVEALLHDTLVTSFTDFANFILKDFTLKDITDGLIGTLPPDAGPGPGCGATTPATYEKVNAKL